METGVVAFPHGRRACAGQDERGGSPPPGGWMQGRQATVPALATQDGTDAVVRSYHLSTMPTASCGELSIRS